jgi:Tfp pilus assembly protein PilN
MKQIDFLPPRYRERRSAHKSHLWRLLVLVAFGAAVGAAAVGQHFLKRSAAAQVEAVDLAHALALAKNSQFSTLERELAEVRAGAQLYAYLKHPWPRTQILLALAEPLPPELTLTEITVSRESLDEQQRSETGRQRRRRESEEAEAGLLPWERDLARLREEYDKRRTVVRITGRTSSIDRLNEYLARLSASPLVAQAELSSLESADKSPEQTASGNSTFHLRILIVAAHGQTEADRQAAARAVAAGGDQ